MAASVFYLASLPLGLNLFDEGIGLTSAERVARGDIPYRDFWSVYAPAGPYLYGGWMSLFGFSVLSARILTAVLLLASAFAMFSIARRLASPAAGLAAFFVAIVWFIANPLHARPLAPAILALLAGLILILRYFREGRGSPFAIGLVGGVLTLFRHDWGFCFCLGFVAASLTSAVLGKASSPGRAVLRPLIGRLLSHAGGILALLVPAILILLKHVRGRDLLSQLVLVHFGGPSAEWALPLPLPFVPRLSTSPPFSSGQILLAGWEGIGFYIPMAVFLFVGWRILAGKERQTGTAAFQAAALACGFGLYTQLYHRSDMEHALSATLIATLLLIRGFEVPFRKWKAAAAGGLLLFVASLPFFRGLQAFSLYGRSDSVRMTLPRSRGIVARPFIALDLQKAAGRVRDLVPPGERIFVGLHRHDLIQFNDALFYFLAERLPATKYHDLPRGIATTAEVQREIIRELDRGPVRCVVLFKSHLYGDPSNLEPNRSRFSSGVHLLDEYIAVHYRREALEGQYLILLRADDDLGPAPGGNSGRR